MYILMSLYIAALFAALTPGVLLKFPKRGSKLTVAVVHGLVFVALYYLTKGIVSRMLYTDGFQGVLMSPEEVAAEEAAANKKAPPKPIIDKVNPNKPKSGKPIGPSLMSPEQIAAAQAAAAAAQAAEMRAATVAAQYRIKQLTYYDRRYEKINCVTIRGKSSCPNNASCTLKNGGTPSQRNPGLCDWDWKTDLPNSVVQRLKREFDNAQKEYRLNPSIMTEELIGAVAKILGINVFSVAYASDIVGTAGVGGPVALGGSCSLIGNTVATMCAPGLRCDPMVKKCVRQ